MAQTTDGLSFVACYVEVNTTGTTWDDVSGFAAAVAVSGGEREVGSQPTFDGDTHIVKGGKRGPVELTFRFVYTEGASDPWAEILAEFEEGPGGQCGIRYVPKGNTAGNYRYSTDSDNTVIKNPVYPQGEAGPGDPVVVEVVVVTAKLDQDTVS